MAWSRTLTQEDVDRRSLPAGEKRLLRVLIDTEHGQIRTLEEDETHKRAAELALRDKLKGNSLTEKMAHLANHLIGGAITSAPGDEYLGVILSCTLDGVRGVRHTKQQIDKAARLLTDYLYRSPIVRKSAVKIHLQEA